MKRYIYSILILVLFAFVGCVKTDELDNNLGRNDEIRLAIRTTSDLVTRATFEDTSLEERIDWVDVFVFNADAEKTIFHKERIDVSAAPVYKSGEFPLLKKREEFGKNTPYYVYLVANAKANLSSAEAGVECWADLQELVQEDTDLHFSAFVDAEGKPAFAGAPARFLMDGFAFLGNPDNPTAKGPEQMGTCVINDPDADDILLCGTLYRAAAKFIININPGANVEFKKELLDADKIAQTPQYYINQLPVSTRVLPQQATDYYNANTQNTATTGLNPYTFVWNDNNSMTIVGYGYSDDWSKLEYTKQTSMVFNLPMLWDEDKDAANGKEASTADNWYTIPLSKEKRFERNTCYVINITVNAVGAEEKEYAIELKDIEYKALPWEEVSMDLGGYGAAFLTLNTDLVKIYDTNIDEDQLTFTSSSPIVSIVLKDTFSHNEQNGSFEQGGAVIGADGLPTGEYTGTDGLYAYYIDKFGKKVQLGTDPGFDIKVVEQPEWTKEQILAKELNLWDAKQTDAEGNNILDDNGDPISKDAKDQYIRAEVWDEHKRALNGNITIHSPILPVADNEDLNWPSHFNTVRYLEFEVTNLQGIKAIFRVEQIPLIYITHEEGYFSYRDDFTRKEGEGPAYWTNYMGPGSVTTYGLCLVHEHDWTEEANRPQSWWDTRQSDRDYGWLDDKSYPWMPNGNNGEDSSITGSELEHWEEVRYAMVAHTVYFKNANGQEKSGFFSGAYRPYAHPTKMFLRERYKNMPGVANMDSKGAAVSDYYTKTVTLPDGSTQERTFRKHYSWDVQTIFWSKYVKHVFEKEDVIKTTEKQNGKTVNVQYRRLKGMAHINSYADDYSTPEAPGTKFIDYTVGRLWRNHRMYHINTTATSSKYSLGFPTLVDDDGRPTNDPKSGTVANTPINARLVSPTLMLASQLGETNYNYILKNCQQYGYILPKLSDFYKIARKQCQQYVETAHVDTDGDGVMDDVVHYDDWRLPTKAEIEMIIDRQTGSRAMDQVLIGEHFVCITGNPGQGDDEKYWVSDEVPGYEVSAEQDLDGRAYSNTGYYIRCVRDVR